MDYAVLALIGLLYVVVFALSFFSRMPPLSESRHRSFFSVLAALPPRSEMLRKLERFCERLNAGLVAFALVLVLLLAIEGAAYVLNHLAHKAPRVVATLEVAA